MITKENLAEVLQEIRDKTYDIPFNHSLYQIEKFILNEPGSKGRLLRQLGLELNSKIETIRGSIIERKKENIDMRKMKAQLDKNSKYYETDMFEREKIELDLQLKESNQPYQEKLLKDAFIELNYMYSVFSQIDPMTREEFEDQEEQHFTNHLLKQVKGLKGAHESLYHMQMFLNANGDLQNIPEEDRTLFQKLGLNNSYKQGLINQKSNKKD